MTDRVSTITVRALRDAPDAGMSGPSTPATRLGMVETLTREAWALAGEPEPSFAWCDAPIRVRSLHTSDLAPPR